MTTQEQINFLESEILSSHAYLQRLDYKTTKLAEKGEKIADEVLQQREAARLKINENEELLVELYGTLALEREDFTDII
jgi:hypothetical protein